MTREQVIEKIKWMGQDVIDRAEDLVGDIDHVAFIGIRLELGPDGFPTIEAKRILHPRLRKEK